MSGRAKRDLCRDICLMQKLQMETDSDQLLMERTESLADDSHEKWVKPEKQHFDDWAGNCWIRKVSPEGRGVYDNAERAQASANPKGWSFDPDG